MADLEDVTANYAPAEDIPTESAASQGGAAPIREPGTVQVGPVAVSPAMRAFVDSGANATPFGKEAVDAITAGLLDLYKRHLNAGGVHLGKASLAEGGADAEDLPTDFHGEYKQARDERAATDAELEAAHPDAALAGKATGTMAGFLAPMPGVKVGAGPLGGALASGVINGAAYGGVGGALDPLLEGDYKRAAEQFKEGAEVGAALGAPMAVLGKGVQVLGSNALRRSALKSGQKALLSGAGQLSNSTTVAPEDVEQALRDKSIPFLGTAETMAERTAARKNETGQLLGQMKSDYASQGVRGPDPVAHGVSLLDAADKAAAKSGAGDPYAGLFRREAESIANKPTLPSGHLDIEQAEAIKSNLQKQARESYARLRSKTSLRGQAQEELAARMNAANEAALQAQLPPDEFERFRQVKDLYGRRAGAADAAGLGARRELTRTPGGMVMDVGAAEALASGDPKGLFRALVGGPIVKAVKERLPSASAVSKYTGANGLRRMGLGTGTSAEALRRLMQQTPEETPQ